MRFKRSNLSLPVKQIPKNKKHLKMEDVEEGEVRSVILQVVLVPVAISIMILFCLIWDCYKSNKNM